MTNSRSTLLIKSNEFIQTPYIILHTFRLEQAIKHSSLLRRMKHELGANIYFKKNTILRRLSLWEVLCNRKPFFTFSTLSIAGIGSEQLKDVSVFRVCISFTVFIHLSTSSKSNINFINFFRMNRYSLITQLSYQLLYNRLKYLSCTYIVDAIVLIIFVVRCAFIEQYNISALRSLTGRTSVLADH